MLELPFLIHCIVIVMGSMMIIHVGSLLSMRVADVLKNIDETKYKDSILNYLKLSIGLIVFNVFLLAAYIFLLIALVIIALVS